jgi:L-fucose isomerase-like protein
MITPSSGVIAPSLDRSELAVTLRVGYVGVHFATYYAEEHGQFTRARAGLADLAAQLSFELVALEDGLMDAEDAVAAARQLAGQHLDLLIVHTAACCMADALLPLVDLGVPLAIWATPEPGIDGDMQLNSLVTASLFASSLRRHYRKPPLFKWFYGHVEEESFRRRLRVTVGALKGRRALAESRVSWIGGLAPGFEDLRFDQRDLEDRLRGAQVLPRELRGLVEMAREFSDDEAQAVMRDMAAGAEAVNVPDEPLERNARLYLALREVCREDQANAVALQDWPDIQGIYEISPLLALCWLAERDGIPTVHEGDVLGALTMRMLGAVAGRLPTVMDLSVIDPERDVALLWHCGGSPHSLADERGATYEFHSTLGRKQDDGPYGAVVDLTLAPGECTLAYISDDARSLWNINAEVFADPDRPGFDGDRGWIRNFRHAGADVPALDLLETVLTTGQEHHHGFVHGDISEELSELSNWMGWHEITPLRYRDALQRPVESRRSTQNGGSND